MKTSFHRKYYILKPGVETLKTYQVIVRTNGIVKVIQQVNEIC